MEFPRQMYRHLVNSIRRDGFASTVLKIVLTLCAPVVDIEIYVLLAKDLTIAPLPRKAKVDLDIRVATEADVPWIVSELGRQGELDSSFPLTVIAFFHSRMRRGEKLFCACSEGELVHVNWTCFSWGEGLSGLPVVPGPAEIYTTDAVTPKRWRGKGIHEVVLNEMLRSASASGVKRAFTLASIVNRRALRGVRHLGWETYGVPLTARVRGTRKALVLRLRGRLDPLLRNIAGDGPAGPPEHFRQLDPASRFFVVDVE